MVLGTMAPGLFALGVTLATDRERGLLKLKRSCRCCSWRLPQSAPVWC
jgi:hypothetical protein